MWWYLENSEVPDLNYAQSTTKTDVIESLEAHMSKCNKSAVINSEKTVFQMYTIYKAMNNPVFWEKI